MVDVLGDFPGAEMHPEARSGKSGVFVKSEARRDIGQDPMRFIERWSRRSLDLFTKDQQTNRVNRPPRKGFVP